MDESSGILIAYIKCADLILHILYESVEFIPLLMTDSKKESLYISADNTFFAGNTLYDIATKFAQQGGRVLYIDEVHKYQDWSKEVKMMYDFLPDLKVVITGSSILELLRGTDADLSRRVIRYKLFFFIATLVRSGLQLQYFLLTP